MAHHFSQTTGPQRLIYGAASGVLAACAPWPLEAGARALLGWTVGVGVFLVLAWWLAVEFDPARTRQRTQSQDEPSIVLFLVLLLSVGASLAAIAFMLQQASGMQAGEARLRVALALLALAASWLFIHTIFAFRYAHRYYQEEMQKEADGPGLKFPGALDPDYFDFMYHAYVVGMTSQVSDVNVTSREMRRLTTVHSVLSFAFNMLVLALSINVVAGSFH